jgi:hypothetical protein
MAAVSTYEISVRPRHNNPEDSHLHTRRRENLKSHLIYCCYYTGLELQHCMVSEIVVPYILLNIYYIEKCYYENSMYYWYVYYVLMLHKISSSIWASRKATAVLGS